MASAGGGRESCSAAGCGAGGRGPGCRRIAEEENQGGLSRLKIKLGHLLRSLMPLLPVTLPYPFVADYARIKHVIRLTSYTRPLSGLQVLSSSAGLNSAGFWSDMAFWS